MQEVTRCVCGHSTWRDADGLFIDCDACGDLVLAPDSDAGLGVGRELCPVCGVNVLSWRSGPRTVRVSRCEACDTVTLLHR